MSYFFGRMVPLGPWDPTSNLQKIQSPQKVPLNSVEAKIMIPANQIGLSECEILAYKRKCMIFPHLTECEVA